MTAALSHSNSLRSPAVREQSVWMRYTRGTSPGRSTIVCAIHSATYVLWIEGLLAMAKNPYLRNSKEKENLSRMMGMASWHEPIRKHSWRSLTSACNHSLTRSDNGRERAGKPGRSSGTDRRRTWSLEKLEGYRSFVDTGRPKASCRWNRHATSRCFPLCKPLGYFPISRCAKRGTFRPALSGPLVRKSSCARQLYKTPMPCKETRIGYRQPIKILTDAGFRRGFTKIIMGE